MKQAWVHLEHWSKLLVTTALECGADALVIPPGWHDKVKALGRITTVSEDGDLRPGKDVYFETLESPEDALRIGELLLQGPVVLVDKVQVKATDARSWEVIPVENLVARGGHLLVPVRSMEEIDLALGILEKGVAGVVIHAHHPEQIKALVARVKAMSEKESLQIATIERIQYVGLGDRVCVDTCSLMQEGEGMLVGNSSAFLFLVQAEAKPNPYIAPRPFRVNAGPVHAYARSPGGRTKYLSELRAGDPILVVNAEGVTREAVVGRVKIERRPLLLVDADFQGMRGSILLQNAETIRLTRPDGGAISVVELKPGDGILVATEQAGRHFGMKVEETILEK